MNNFYTGDLSSPLSLLLLLPHVLLLVPGQQDGVLAPAGHTEDLSPLQLLGSE